MSVTPEIFYTYVSPKAQYSSDEARKSSYWEPMPANDIPMAYGDKAEHFIAFRHVVRDGGYKAKLIGLYTDITTDPTVTSLSFLNEADLKTFNEALTKSGFKCEQPKAESGPYKQLRLTVTISKESYRSHFTKLARCINSLEKLPSPIIEKICSSLKYGSFNYQEALKEELAKIFNTFLNSLASSDVDETETLDSAQAPRMSAAEKKTWAEAFQFAEVCKSSLLYMVMADNYSRKLKSPSMRPLAILAGVKLIDNDDTVRLNLDPRLKGQLYYLAAKLNLDFYTFPDQGADAPGKDSNKETDEFLRIAFKQAVEASRAGHPQANDLIVKITDTMRKRPLVYLPGPANYTTPETTMDMLFEFIGTVGTVALKPRSVAPTSVAPTNGSASYTATRSELRTVDETPPAPVVATGFAFSSSPILPTSPSRVGPTTASSLPTQQPVLAFSAAALSSGTATSLQSSALPVSGTTNAGAVTATPPASASSSQPSMGSTPAVANASGSAPSDGKPKATSTPKP